MGWWIGLIGLAFILSVINAKGEIVAQIDELRAAIAQVGTDLGEAIQRVEDKLIELGDPDPDLAADIAALKGVSEQLDDLVANEPEPTPTSTPAEPPAESTPAEPTPGLGGSI